MFNLGKNRKTRKQLKLENIEQRDLIARLESQMKEQIEMLLKSNTELRQLKNEISKISSIKKESLTQLNYRLRTPLNDLIGMTSLMENTELNNTQREYLGFTKIAGNKLLNILNDVLFYLRAETGALNEENKVIDLRELMEKLFAEFKIQSKTSEFYWKADSDIPELLRGESEKLKVIFHNIIKIALINSTDRIVVVEAKTAGTEGDKILLRMNINVKMRTLIDEEKENMFIPFSLADKYNNENETSTGLELAIANSIVRQAGGELCFDYHEGNISVFSLKLSFSKHQ